MERSRLFKAALVLAIICLVGLLFYAIVATPPAAQGWETDGNGSADYMLAGSNDTVYVFSGNHVAAVRHDGSQTWALDVPGEWRVLNNWMIHLYTSSEGSYGKIFRNLPIVDERSGYLYLFVTRGFMTSDTVTGNGTGSSTDIPSQVLAINPEGSIEWTYDFTVDNPGLQVPLAQDPRFVYMESTIAIKASCDRVYLFHDYGEDVLDMGGRLLFTLHNVTGPVSIDDKGRIYLVETTRLDDAAFSALEKKPYLGDISPDGEDTGHILPSSIVNAYGPDGSLLWSRDIGESAVRAPLASNVWQKYNALPLYVNGTLYVSLDNGVAALDEDGNLKWVRHIPGGVFSLFRLMPVDGHGNVYLEELTAGDDISAVYTIAPDGNVSSSVQYFTTDGYDGRYHRADYPVPVAGTDGIIYAVGEYPPVTDGSFNDIMGTLHFEGCTIKAIDAASGRSLWNFNVPEADRHAVILNESNINVAARLSPESCGGYSPCVENKISVYPGSDITYVSYDFTIFDYPVIYNVSRCFYARGIYALDNDGRLLWEAHPEGFVDRAAAGNGTIYYLTSNGRMGGSTAGIAAGVALTALAYLFLRFLMLGTVARAKGRLDRNENRNDVLRHVAEHPGLTATDLSRALGMNMGTIRYHLFILTVNHKVVTHREDDRYLRYFRNAGAYSPEERTLLSLMRREPLRRMLDVIAVKPGLSGSALARELGISPTAANRHIALLARKGVVKQISSPGKGSGYAICEAYDESIKRMLKHV